MFVTELLLVVLIAGILIYLAFIIGKKSGSVSTNRDWEKKLPKYREDAVKRSRAVLSGQFSEQLAPFLPDFPWNPTESRFLGKPIDFLVFKGLDKKEVEEVVFVEVKSGRSRLNAAERSLKDAIEEKRVRWEEYRIPLDLTEHS